MPLRYVAPAYSPVDLRAAVEAAFAPGFVEIESVVSHKLATRFGADRVRLVDSGTTALKLAIAAAHAVRAGHCVLPAFGCYDLASAAIGAGVPVQLYDVSPKTLAPDWDSLENVSDNASSIVVVHPFGLSVDLLPAHDIAARTGARLIEDTAQGIGGMLSNRPLGTTGDYAILSFGRGKGLNGNGGGALLARGEAAADDISVPAAAHRRLPVIVTAVLQELLSHPIIYGLPASLPFLHIGETRYKPPHPTEPITLGSLQLLFRHLDQVSAESAARSQNARRLHTAFMRDGVSTPADAMPAESGWLRFPVLVPDDRPLTPEPRIGVVRSYPMPLNQLPALLPHLIRRNDFIGAERLAGRLLTLPTHSRLSPHDLDRLEGWIRHCFVR